VNRPAPSQPKICHIVHLDKLPSILAADGLLCDAEIIRRAPAGTTIGMGKIKERRLTLPLNSHPTLHVGDCVPFYFCPRSVMLYMFHMDNHEEIDYHGGQEPIIHLVADLSAAVQWANANNLRWAFTDSNAGSFFFNDYSDLAQLSNIDWDAVCARFWVECRDRKQAEFLMEKHFPWRLIENIGVYATAQQQQVMHILQSAAHRPAVQVMPDWYY